MCFLNSQANMPSIFNLENVQNDIPGNYDFLSETMWSGTKLKGCNI